MVKNALNVPNSNNIAINLVEFLLHHESFLFENGLLQLSKLNCNK